MSLASINEIEQFRTIVDQLDACCEFIEEDTITKNRITIILLDNISEILLQRCCQPLFDHDEFTKWIVPQEFVVSKKLKISKYFDEKIRVIESRKDIPREISQVLSVGHRYRNDIYHRDKHNRNTIGIITKIFFVTVCDFFEKIGGGFAGISIGGQGKAYGWLEKYGLNKSPINFSQSSCVIATVLKRRVDLKILAAAEIFTRDILKRIDDIKQLVNKELPWKSPAQLNSIIKWFEFKERYPEIEDQLSEDYRKYNYKIGKGETVGITPEKFKEAEEKFRQEYYKKVEEYQPKIAYSLTTSVVKNVQALKENKKLSNLLSAYYDLDKALSELEKYLDLARAEWDRIVQHEIDLQLGK
jgi:hypothetical protein